MGGIRSGTLSDLSRIGVVVKPVNDGSVHETFLHSPMAFSSRQLLPRSVSTLAQTRIQIILTVADRYRAHGHCYGSMYLIQCSGHIGNSKNQCAAVHAWIKCSRENTGCDIIFTLMKGNRFGNLVKGTPKVLTLILRISIFWGQLLKKIGFLKYILSL